MGFEDNRFDCTVDEVFRCPICQEIIESPVVSQCEHVFCKTCINQWLESNTSCPVDREPLNKNQLREPSRIFRNFYSKLMIKCENNLKGCEIVCNIESLEKHENECPFSESECENECGAVLKRNELSSHSCVQYLKTIIIQLKHESELNSETSKQKEEENGNLIKYLEEMIGKLCGEIPELKPKMNKEWPETSNSQTSIRNLDVNLPSPKFRTTVIAINPKHIKLIELLKDEGYITTSRVRNILLSIDRKYFCPGFNYNLSALYMHAIILELLVNHLKDNSSVTVLDIGSGSGYLTLCMAEMSGFKSKVIGIDIEFFRIQKTNKILKNHFYHLSKKVQFIHKDGKEGHKINVKYDVINISRAVVDVPQSIIEQLNIGGRIIAIVVPKDGPQLLVTIDKLANGSLKRVSHFSIDKPIDLLKSRPDCTIS